VNNIGRRPDGINQPQGLPPIGSGSLKTKNPRQIQSQRLGSPTPSPTLQVERLVGQMKTNPKTEELSNDDLLQFLEAGKEIVITPDVMKRLLPKGLLDVFEKEGKGTPALWESDPHFDPRLLDALLKAMDEGRVKEVMDRNGVRYEELPHANGLAKNLYHACLDYDKAQIIGRAFDKHLGFLLPDQKAALMTKLVKYVDYVGPNTTNIRKIMEHSGVTKDVIAHRQIKEPWEAFLADISKEMEIFIEARVSEGDRSREEANMAPITPETVVVTTTSSGGAHISISNVLTQSLKSDHIPNTLVNESNLVPEDNLKRFFGIPRSVVFNKISQQCQQMTYGKQLKLLDDKLSKFSPDQNMNAFRRAIGNSEFIVSTSHHPENVRAVAEKGKRVCFQICDYGQLPDKLEKIAKTVARYDLEGITFFTPSDNSVLPASKKEPNLPLLRPGAAGLEKSLKELHATQGITPARKEELEKRYRAYAEFAKVHHYPVNRAFVNQVNITELQDARRKQGIRPNSKMWLMAMGSQGVGGVLEKRVGEVIAGVIEDIRKKRVENIDLVILYGTNDKMKEDLSTFFKKELEKQCRDAKMQKTEVQYYLKFLPLGRIDNDQVALLGKASSAFFSKPGGGTSAEGLLGGFPMILHREPKSFWEFGNIQELVEKGATELNPSDNFYEAAKKAARVRAPHVMDDRKHCVDYAVGVLWRLEQEREKMNKRKK